MKKTFLIFVAILGFAIASNAQPKAIGGRGGYGIDVSYENYIGANSDFLEFELGLDGYKGSDFHVDGIYNFMFLEPNWTPAGKWGFYGGPGAGLAVLEGANNTNEVYAGVLGTVGLEYTFDFPLQLSIDLRPRIMFGGGGNVYADGIFRFGIGARYAF